MMLSRFFFLAAGLWASCGCLNASEKAMIPALNWEIRSDWTSVKEPKTWHNLVARGDGVSDDTAAIQASIATAAPMGGTVYLPPGKYRITSSLMMGTLQLDSSTRPRGFSLIGHGRDTVIFWDGEEDLPMLQLLGICESRILGVTFDARNKASACLQMGGSGFQSHNLFRHCAFLNARFAGIDSGRVKINTSCTEQRIDNCLFENCGRGISLLDFNDYDCVVSGSEFRECGYGIMTFKGNFYCRNSHFENSKIADFSVESEHTSTIRRCTSLNSQQFLNQKSPHCATVIEDCRIAGWSSPEGAISQNIVPALIFDTTFEDRKQIGIALRFAHTESENLVSCNRFANSDYFKLIRSNSTFSYQSEKEVRVYDLPAGKRSPSKALRPETSFLKTRAIHGVWSDIPGTACIPGKIFDVKRDFGARGGEADDTQAFQAAINAAKAYGNGAMVYFPKGHYTVRETLVLDGCNWYFGGSGTKSILSWYGAEEGTLLEIRSPRLLGVIDFEMMRQGGRKDGIDIIHLGGGSEESLTIYDSVRAHGFLVAEALKRGFRFRNLGRNDKVLASGTYGNLRFTDCQNAEILMSEHYEGCLMVEGKNPERNGILAVQFALLEICDPCIWVKDNNSLVMTDFYNEQSKSLYRFEGNGASVRGRINLGSIKVEAVPRHFTDYQGEIILWTPQYYNNLLRGYAHISIGPKADIDYLEVGSYYFCHSLNWDPVPGFRPRFLAVGGGPVKGQTVEEFLQRHADATDSGAFQMATRGLDDFRRVGNLDLRLNHPKIALDAP